MSQSCQNATKSNWTEQQQSYLEALCRIQKIPDWKYISTEINTVYPEKTRSSKQCRERYHNYIKYNKELGKNLPWTAQEDLRLFQMYVGVGSQWAIISKSIPARSENSIKNRFYGKLRKFIRTINEVLRHSSLRNKKPIKQNTITKILSREKFSNQFKLPPSPTQGADGLQPISGKFLEDLKYDIVRNVLDNRVQCTEDSAYDILGRIHLFNLMAKSENIRENRKGKNIKRKKLPPLLQLPNPNPQPPSTSTSTPTLTAPITQPPQTQPPQKQNQESPQESPILKDSYLNQLQLQQYFNNPRPMQEMLQNQMRFIFDVNVCSQKQDGFF